MEGVELPGVAAGWRVAGWWARRWRRGRGGSRGRSAACSPESWGEPVLWLTGLESTRGQDAGTEGAAGAGARPRCRRRLAGEDSSQGHGTAVQVHGRSHGAIGSPCHVMKLRSARRPCCTFEPRRSTMTARTMTRTTRARRSAGATQTSVGYRGSDQIRTEAATSATRRPSTPPMTPIACCPTVVSARERAAGRSPRDVCRASTGVARSMPRFAANS